MIVKTKKGRGFRGVLDYNLQAGKGHILASNMAGDTPRALAREFGAVRALRPTLGKAVQHTSISAAPGEHLTDDQWRAIGERYLQHMGFADSQALIIRHTDREHEHIHIIANRVTNTGGVVSDSKDYERQETLMRQLEQDFGLQQVKPSRESPKRAPTRGELEHSLRTGQPSIKSRLQALLDAASDARTFTEYVDRLEAAGVQVVPTVQQGGAKLTGTLYVLDGEKMKGGDLGKSYTAAGIQKRGIEYEQNRDLETVRRCRERAGLDGAGAAAPGRSEDIAGAGEVAQQRAALDRRGVGAPHRADAGHDGGAGAVGHEPAGDGGSRDREGGGFGERARYWAGTRVRPGRGSVGELPRDPASAKRLANVALPVVGAGGGGATRRISDLGRWAEARKRELELPRPAGVAAGAVVRDAQARPDATTPAAPAPTAAPVKKDARGFLDDFWSAERQAERAAQERAARDLVERDRLRRQQEEEAKARAREARRQPPAPRHDQPPPRPAPRRDTPSRDRSGPSIGGM